MHDDEPARPAYRPETPRPGVQGRAPEPRWIGDTTQLVTGDGKLYLAVIVDLFSRFAVGWALSAVNDRHFTIRALDMALRRRCPDAGLVHHSDQGSTYASEDYRNVLDAHGITCSMSRRGNVYDNAAMESWFSTLKSELGERFESHAAAKEQLFDNIEVFYNQQRRHSAIGYATPPSSREQHGFSWSRSQPVCGIGSNPPTLAAILKEWKGGGWARFMGREPRPDDLIVPSATGKPRNNAYTWRCFRDDLRTLGIAHQRHYETRSTFINLAEAGGAPPEDVHRLTHASLGEAKDLYRRIPQQWPRLCRAVEAIQIAPTGEVSQSVSQSVGELAPTMGSAPDSPRIPDAWMLPSVTPQNGRAGESNPPTAPLSTIHRF